MKGYERIWKDWILTISFGNSESQISFGNWGVAQLIYSPTRLFRTKVYRHTLRALPAGIEPTTQRVAGCCSTSSTSAP
jgi:hypothetical protein